SGALGVLAGALEECVEEHLGVLVAGVQVVLVEGDRVTTAEVSGACRPRATRAARAARLAAAAARAAGSAHAPGAAAGIATRAAPARVTRITDDDTGRHRRQGETSNSTHHRKESYVHPNFLQVSTLLRQGLREASRAFCRGQQHGKSTACCSWSLIA